MLQIDGYKVFMTKGDTGILSLTIYDKKGELYRPNSNDVCLLTMKKYASQSSKELLTERMLDLKLCQKTLQILYAVNMYMIFK